MGRREGKSGRWRGGSLRLPGAQSTWQLGGLREAEGAGAREGAGVRNGETSREGGDGEREGEDGARESVVTRVERSNSLLSRLFGRKKGGAEGGGGAGGGGAEGRKEIRVYSAQFPPPGILLPKVLLPRSIRAHPTLFPLSTFPPSTSSQAHPPDQATSLSHSSGYYSSTLTYEQPISPTSGWGLQGSQMEFAVAGGRLSPWCSSTSGHSSPTSSSQGADQEEQSGGEMGRLRRQCTLVEAGPEGRRREEGGSEEGSEESSRSEEECSEEEDIGRWSSNSTLQSAWGAGEHLGHLGLGNPNHPGHPSHHGHFGHLGSMIDLDTRFRSLTARRLVAGLSLGSIDTLVEVSLNIYFFLEPSSRSCLLISNCVLHPGERCGYKQGVYRDRGLLSVSG